jgi:hypothetical protein
MALNLDDIQREIRGCFNDTPGWIRFPFQDGPEILCSVNGQIEQLLVADGPLMEDNTITIVALISELTRGTPETEDLIGVKTTGGTWLKLQCKTVSGKVGFSPFMTITAGAITGKG